MRKDEGRIGKKSTADFGVGPGHSPCVHGWLGERFGGELVATSAVTETRHSNRATTPGWSGGQGGDSPSSCQLLVLSQPSTVFTQWSSIAAFSSVEAAQVDGSSAWQASQPIPNNRTNRVAIQRKTSGSGREVEEAGQPIAQLAPANLLQAAYRPPQVARCPLSRRAFSSGQPVTGSRFARREAISRATRKGLFSRTRAGPHVVETPHAARGPVVKTPHAFVGRLLRGCVVSRVVPRLKKQGLLAPEL